jgi:mobilization protein NikA
MARPKLRPEDRRDERLPAPRVTASERVEAERKAEAAGMSLSDFGREAYLNAVVTTRRGSTDEAVIVALNRIGVDFSRMCSNLNQITNNNSGRQLSPEFPFVMQEAASMMAEIKELIAKVDHGS